MGRVQAAKKNILFGYVGQIVTMVMAFVLRTFCMRYISEQILGVDGTFIEVLSFLNMAELGIGTALNFSLYKPVAEGDTEKIKSYMQMYRRAYYYIAGVVGIVGLILAPFLKYLVKNPGVPEKDLVLFYLIFLFNTVSSYFVAYKYSLVNAEQKNYIQTNIIAITKIVTSVFQIIVVALTKNYYFYLITDAVIQLIQKIFVSRYLDNMYPYLKEKNIEKLAKEDEEIVWTKTKALVFHKVGDVFRLQTDTLIISSLSEVGAALVAVVRNYNMIIVAVSSFVNIIFNSVISSFGNLIATEDRDKQYSMFKVYRFFATWVYGFSCVGFMLLLTPLVEMWTKISKGDKWTDFWILPALAVFLILTDYYFKGERIVLSNYKTAAGVFEQDKYLALIQGIVNLILSIWLVQTRLGIAGIYVGTVVSGIIANITKPVIIYKACFDKSAVSYFIDSFKYIASMAFVMGICYFIRQLVMPVPTVTGFIVMVVIITVVFNGVYLLLYGRSEEFRYLCGKLKSRKA